MDLIDSHAHLSSPSVYPEVDQLLERAKTNNIKAIVNICTDPTTLTNGLELQKKYPWVFNVGSTTPHDVEKEGEICFELFAKHAREGDLVAVGETGLDYHYNHSPKLLQQEFLRRYLRLSIECKLPVVIHCRDAFDDFFKILNEEYKNRPGVLHCFTGTIDEAKQVIAQGFYLSLSGIVTFKRSHELREVAKIVPLDKLLIETDTPYLAPQSRRGKQNEPSFLPEILDCIAEAKGLPREVVAKASFENACHLFNLSL